MKFDPFAGVNVAFDLTGHHYAMRSDVTGHLPGRTNGHGDFIVFGGFCLDWGLSLCLLRGLCLRGTADRRGCWMNTCQPIFNNGFGKLPWATDEYAPVDILVDMAQVLRIPPQGDRQQIVPE